MDFEQVLDYIKANAYTIGQQAVHGNEAALKIILTYGAFNRLKDATNKALLTAAVENHQLTQLVTQRS